MPLTSVGNDGTKASTQLVVSKQEIAKPPVIDPPKPGPSPWIPVIIGVTILIAAGFLLDYMLDKTSLNNSTQWDRLLLLYNSVQTIVVAAASALLGVQVSAAQTAAARASGAQSEARVSQLESNIKGFQNTIKSHVGGSERGAPANDRTSTILAEAMTLLH